MLKCVVMVSAVVWVERVGGDGCGCTSRFVVEGWGRCCRNSDLASVYTVNGGCCIHGGAQDMNRFVELRDVVSVMSGAWVTRYMLWR